MTIRRIVLTLLCGLILALGSFGPVHAVSLTFSFIDPVGDAFLFPGQVGPATDVTGLVFHFDNATGDYQITITASAANPFFGDSIINVNLFNPDTGTTADNPSYFTDQQNQFSLSSPTTTINLIGVDSKLLSWEIGDRVAACSGPGGIIPETCKADLGHPDSTTAFQTGVINTKFGVPFENISRDSFQDPPTATIAPIPAPPSNIPTLPSNALILLALLMTTLVVRHLRHI